MKLYKIKVLHGAPKDSHESIETYIVAEDDEEVYNWLKKKAYWDYYEDNPEDENGLRCREESPYDEMSFKEYVMLYKGDLKDDEGWEDAYYGVTKWGWEEVGEISESEKRFLTKCGIIGNL